MSLNMDQIAEAFCSHKFVETYPYMADEIKWNIIGREKLVGQEAVIDQCNKSAKFLETVPPHWQSRKFTVRRLV